MPHHLRFLALLPLMLLASACLLGDGDDGADAGSSPSPTPTATASVSPTPAGDAITVGAIVVVRGTGDCLNLREQPVRDAPVIICLQDGQQLRALEGPRESDAIHWWKVERVGGFTGVGWVSAEYIAPAS